MEYLDYDKFIKMYPPRYAIGRGGYGVVHESQNVAVVIKKIADKNDNIGIDGINELDVYSSNNHPCLMKVLAWTYRSPHLLFSMPKGIDIVTAYKNKLITAEQIVSDTLSCVVYLHSQGLMHGDIKPDNIVFYDGKATLIDMGMARSGILFEDGLFVEQYAFTWCYRDPQYSPGQWNPIETELFALAKTWHDIFTDHKYGVDNIYTFEYPDNSSINTLIREMKRSVFERMSAAELLELAKEQGVIVREWEGYRLTTPVINFDKNCGSVNAILMDWLFDAAVEFKLSASTLFLCLNLVHRSLSLILPDYSEDTFQTVKVQSVGCACLFLAAINDKELVTVKELTSICDGAYTSEMISNMIINVMKVTQCIITSPTYWNYANYAEDLPELLNDTINCNYDPSRIRELRAFGSPKNILASQIEWHRDKTGADRIKMLEASMSNPIVFKEPSIIRSSDITIEESLDEVISVWKNIHAKSKYNAVITGIFVLNYNKSVLKDLPEKLSLDIYTIINSNPEYEALLAKLVNFDPRDKEPISNPFAETVLFSDSVEPFIVACAKGDLELVEKYLSDPTFRAGAIDNLALREAIGNDKVEVVKLLINDSRVDPADNDNYCIAWAADGGFLDLVKLLLADSRVDPAAGENLSIYRAVRNNHMDVVETLLADSRVDPSADDNAAICIAVKMRLLNMVNRLLTDSRVDPNPGLLEAAKYGYIDIVTRLLERKEIKSSTIRECIESLPNDMAAKDPSHRELNPDSIMSIVELLINDRRCNLETKNLALVWASDKGNLELVRKLLTANVDSTFIQDNKALIRAVVKGHLDIVKLLLADSRINPTSEYNTAISLACWKENLDIIKLLLADSRIDPSAGNNRALNESIQEGRFEIVKILLDDPRIDPSANNNRALQYAINYNRIEMIELLLAHSRFDPTSKIVHSKTREFLAPVQLARRLGKIEIVKRLLEDPRVNPKGLTYEKYTQVHPV